jgi:hypothetical protein
MAKRIEVYNTFEESEEKTHRINLSLSYWQRWIKGIELSEFALKCVNDPPVVYSTKSGSHQFNLFLPNSKKE